MGYLTDLTDEQWAWIKPVFSPQEGPGRRRSVSLRRVLDALMYQDRTGCQWRLIPRDVDTIWDSPLLFRQMER
jgi:transposase